MFKTVPAKLKIIFTQTENRIKRQRIPAFYCLLFAIAQNRFRRFDYLRDRFKLCGSTVRQQLVDQRHRNMLTLFEIAIHQLIKSNFKCISYAYQGRQTELCCCPFYVRNIRRLYARHLCELCLSQPLSFSDFSYSRTNNNVIYQNNPSNKYYQCYCISYSDMIK